MNPNDQMHDQKVHQEIETTSESTIASRLDTWESTLNQTPVGEKHVDKGKALETQDVLMQTQAMGFKCLVTPCQSFHQGLDGSSKTSNSLNTMATLL